MTQLRAVGVTAGIGSMLAAARAAGFEVLANIEWREFAHVEDRRGQNTFKMNFPGAPFPRKIKSLLLETVDRLTGTDLIVSHPECGHWSKLDAVNRKGSDARSKDTFDIPLTVNLIAELKPRFFILDDLPGSLTAFPMSEYARRLPGFDIFPELVSNYHYGNCQKGRERFFMVGALKEERFAFVPGEDPAACPTLRGVIGDLCDDAGEPVGNFLNHRRHVVDEFCANATGVVSADRRSTWREVQDHMRERQSGYTLKYFHRDGSVKTKIGFTKTYWDGHCHVLDGGSPTTHPLRNLPLTIRERARIQGFPDDFVFYGEVTDDDLRWDHYKNNPLIKQTGKAIPLQFVTYACRQIAAHINKQDFRASNVRALRPNKHVDDAKKWFCSEVGYANQERACAACWLRAGCPIRAQKNITVADYPQASPLVVPASARRGSAPTTRPRRSRRFVDLPPEAEYDLFGDDPAS